jgi:hypothetical protein
MGRQKELKRKNLARALTRQKLFWNLAAMNTTLAEADAVKPHH